MAMVENLCQESTKPKTREERVAEALRESLRKRKEQEAARAAKNLETKDQQKCQ